MNNKTTYHYKTGAFCLLLLANLHLVAQQTRAERAQVVYNLLKQNNIEAPKTVLAVAIVETGWLECKHCTLQFNNLFGFRTNKGYMKFEDFADCVEYLGRWQKLYYLPWKEKHPTGTYYQFLRHMRYAVNMDSYIRKLQWMETWITENVESDGTF